MHTVSYAFRILDSSWSVLGSGVLVGVLKDIMVGFIYFQTVSNLLWVAFLQGMDLATHVSGKFVRDLQFFFSTEHIKLSLWNFLS